MRLGVLGSLLVVDEAGEEIALPVRLRTLLAALLVHANRVVAVPELAEIVWDGAPSAEAASTLRTYILRLRRALGLATGARIETLDPGYLCRVGEGELDVLAFEVLCRDAGAAVRAGGWARAVDAAQVALGLWRGAPLLDVPSQVLRDGCVPRLEQLRLQLLEDHTEARLRLGGYEQLAPELRELAGTHPLRERFHAQLMTALACSGRRAEALEAYRDARQALVEQLGVEPGPELRELHHRILAGEDARAWNPSAHRPSASAPGAAGGVGPRQLPAAPGHFVGRHAELEVLTALPDRAGPAGVGGTVVISAIDGMTGIGKTALAIHAAHRLAGAYPDGQLFLDLHGYTQDQQPRTTAQALEWLLRALGVSPQQIPKDDEQAAALYRQRLSDTRTLIVLDNAAAEAQVRPLLPGGGSCLVLITSRRRLKGLDDALSLSLDLLPKAEAVALLRAVAGIDRVASGDPLLGEIAHLCGRLPLALRIAGALLRHRPAWDLNYLAALLRDQHQRLPALSDGERDLGTVFNLSYRSLGTALRRVFRYLGLIPGPDTDPYAVAALTDSDPVTAARLLEQLVDDNLLISHAPGRYRLHDLLRAHARDLAAADPQPDRDAALDGLLRYYAYTAHSASALIARHPRSAARGTVPLHVPALPDAEAARIWLRAERDNLEAAFTHAHAFGLHAHGLALAAGLAEILIVDGPFAHAVKLHQTAVETAACLGDPAASAAALTELGRAKKSTGDHAGAHDALSQALKIHRATGNRHGEALSLTELGTVQHLTGDMTTAADTLTQALQASRAIGNRRGEAIALAELGIVQHLAGDLAEAADTNIRALDIYRATGQRTGEANALIELGNIRRQAGDLVAAGDALSQALEIHRVTGHRNGEAHALMGLGIVRRQAGDLVAAGDALSQALEAYRAMGNPHGEANALTGLGMVRRLAGDLVAAGEMLCRALEIYRATGQRGNEAWALNHYAAVVADGDLPRALTLYRQALTMNRELNKPDDEAVALEGIAECHLSADEPESGTRHLKDALEIFQRLGMASDAERVRTRLANLAAA
jgi:DNA-binding SARP family transcriptional activator